MKTHFNILFIDDVPESIESIIPQIQQCLEIHGLCLQHQIISEVATIDEVLKEILHGNLDYNLIITDFNLSNEIHGNHIIEAIRKNDLYHPIIFYSAATDFIESTRNIADQGGIYRVAKESMAIQLAKLIDFNIKQTSDIDTFRGWVVADAIQLEFIIDEILKRILTDQIFSHIVDKPLSLDFFKKMCLLTRLLSSQINPKLDNENKKFLERLKTQLKKFEDEVIHIRNTLAHNKILTKNPEKKIVLNHLKSDLGSIIFPDDCSKIRLNIQNHTENLNRILSLVEKTLTSNASSHP